MQDNEIKKEAFAAADSEHAKGRNKRRDHDEQYRYVRRTAKSIDKASKVIFTVCYVLAAIMMVTMIFSALILDTGSPFVTRIQMAVLSIVYGGVMIFTGWLISLLFKGLSAFLEAKAVELEKNVCSMSNVDDTDCGIFDE